MPKPRVRPEIGYVLFMDIVGYSKKEIDEQHALIEQLTEIVRTSETFQAAANQDGKLIRLPTGDGIALVFMTGPDSPAECALEIAQAIKDWRRAADPSLAFG